MRPARMVKSIKARLMEASLTHNNEDPEYLSRTRPQGGMTGHPGQEKHEQEAPFGV